MVWEIFLLPHFSQLTDTVAAPSVFNIMEVVQMDSLLEWMGTIRWVFIWCEAVVALIRSTKGKK